MSLRANRSMPTVDVIPVLTYADVADAVAWTFSQLVDDVDPASWGGVLVSA